MKLEDLAVPAPQPRAVGFDPEKLYVALDRRRRELRISRRELLRQIGENTPSSITRLGQGHHPSADLLARYLVWLGDTDLGPYLSPAESDYPLSETYPGSGIYE